MKIYFGSVRCRIKGWRNIVQLRTTVRNILFKSKKWRYLWKCYVNRDNDSFVEDVLNNIESPNTLRVKHNGNKNKGKIIYLISEQGTGFGFFAELRAAWAKLLFADRMGLIPFVHYGESYIYYDKDIKEIENAFEYYFKPTSAITDVYESSNVVQGDLQHSHYIEEEYGNEGYYVTEEFIRDIADIVKKYVQYNDKTKFFLERSWSELSGSESVLGVHYRGSDFRKGFNKHPIPVTVEQVLEQTVKFFNSGKYEAIFLATDDMIALDSFKKKFGVKLLWYQDVFRTDGKISVAFSNEDRENHKYKLGLEVLRDVYTLSHCKGLVCGLSQIGFAARVFKKSYDEKYEDFCLIDNGVFRNTMQFDKGIK